MSNSQAQNPMTDALAAPMIVRLVGTESLLPHGLPPRAAADWLAAPIGGQPLFRRILETWVGLPIAAVVCDDGPVGRAFAALAARVGVFGWPVTTRSAWGSISDDEERPVFVADGAVLIDADLCTAVREHANGTFLLHAHGRVIGGYVRRPADRRAASAVLHLETMLDRLLGAVSAQLQAVEVEAFELRSASDVHCLAIAVTEGDLAGHPAFGRRHGDVLIGPRARFSAGASGRGTSEVGAETKISGGAVLGHGAMIGAGAYVGHGALVLESILLDGAVVRAGEVVRGRIRGRGIDLEMAAADAGRNDHVRMAEEFSRRAIA